MWHDIETTEDFLNFGVVAQTAANFIKESGENPISVGVSGNWGVGKTSLVKMIRLEIENSGDKSYCFIDFNAWLYQGYDDARMALLQTVADFLLEKTKENQSLFQKAKAFCHRVNLLRFFKSVVPTIAGCAGGYAISGNASGAIMGAISGAVGATTGSIAQQATQVTEKLVDLHDSVKNSILPEPLASLPQEIQKIRDEFESLLHELQIKLVVIVDDLDRCLPDTAISTLEAMRLLLFMKNTAFIIAADENMIRKAVSAHFEGSVLSDELVTNYFDKLIQVPISVPCLGISEIRAYLMMLLAQDYLSQEIITHDEYKSVKEFFEKKLKSSWNTAITGKELELAWANRSQQTEIAMGIKIADELAPLLATSRNILGNPRLIKRFLNEIKIRQAIAHTQGMNIPWAQLVKFQLLLRCAPPKAIDFMQQELLDSNDGKLVFLKNIENELTNNFTYKAPDASWEDSFIEKWVMLQPPLGDVDLRPLFHLRKDSIGATVSYRPLSSDAQTLFEEIRLASQWDRSFEDKINNLGKEEKKQIFTYLLREIEKGAWEANSVNKILMMADICAELRGEAHLLLEQIPPVNIHPSHVSMVSRYSWAKTTLSKWKEFPSLKTTVVKAIEQKLKERA